MVSSLITIVTFHNNHDSFVEIPPNPPREDLVCVRVCVCINLRRWQQQHLLLFALMMPLFVINVILYDREVSSLQLWSFSRFCRSPAASPFSLRNNACFCAAVHVREGGKGCQPSSCCQSLLQHATKVRMNFLHLVSRLAPHRSPECIGYAHILKYQRASCVNYNFWCDQSKLVKHINSPYLK